jgi:hypothetical protein
MPSGDTTRKRTGPGRPVIQTRRESRDLADTLVDHRDGRSQ